MTIDPALRHLAPMLPTPRPAGWALQPGEPAPYRSVNETGHAPFVLVCDHASPRVPVALTDLGLAPHLLGLHIGFDIGIEALTRELSQRMDARTVLSSYSRLVIDMNRGLRFDDSIPPASDGHAIPGNQDLSAGERERRAHLLFHPYHDAVARTLASLAAPKRHPGLISMHSFTPHMGAATRPWHVGVLWKYDGRIAEPLIDALRHQGLTVGDNEPYSSFDPRGFTVEAHAERFGYPNVLIEVRQDLLTDEAGIDEWAGRLTDALGPILADASLYR